MITIAIKKVNEVTACQNQESNLNHLGRLPGGVRKLVSKQIKYFRVGNVDQRLRHWCEPGPLGARGN